LGGKDDSREVSVSEAIERLVLDLDLLGQQRRDDLHVDVRLGVPHPLDRLHAVPGEVLGKRRQEVVSDLVAHPGRVAGAARISRLERPRVAGREEALVVALDGSAVVGPGHRRVAGRLEDFAFQRRRPLRGVSHRPYLPPLAFLAPPTVATTFVGFFDTDDGNLEAAPLAVL
jgi:hypothetical protein